MSFFRVQSVGLVWLILYFAVGRQVFGAVVINEIVKEERTAGAGAVTPDAREFVELYNNGTEPVDISGWTISTYRLSGTTAALPGTYFFTDTIQAGTTLQPGGFFTIGNKSGVPEVDQDLGAGIELYEDLRATVMELRRGPRETAPIEDAVGYDMFFASNAPPAGVTFVPPTAEQAAEIGNGVWGQQQSYNITETADFKRLSLSRYQDGRDTNRNGLDFGYLPLTPGASNNLPLTPVHVVPNVDSLNPGDPVTAYSFGFKPARVIDPATIGPPGEDPDGTGPFPQQPINQRVIDAPPRASKAITVWDETGGGNSIYSKEYVNKFDIYAYLDSTPFNLPGDWELESTAYGIGTTEPLFANPNPENLIPTAAALLNTGNSSTGIGWMYQRFQEAPAAGGDNINRLLLVDFGEGGNSVPSAAKWDVKAEFDLTTEQSGWHRLGIEYDPATGQVTARFGDEIRTFTTDTNLLGTFYAAYREALTAVPGDNVGISRGATFVQYAPPAGLTGDFNGNGVVDAADYVLWRNGDALQNEGGITPGDATPEDYESWRANFGKSAGGAAAVGAAVPEPAGAALVGMGVLVLAWARSVDQRKRRCPRRG